MYVDFKKQSFKKLLVFCVVKSVRFEKKLYQKLFSIFNKKIYIHVLWIKYLFSPIRLSLYNVIYLTGFFFKF